MNLTKLKLAKTLSEASNISIEASKEFVDAFFQIQQAFLSDSNLKISGFGTYQKRISPSRTGRNPKTMEVYEIPARLKVYFKASAKIKKDIN